MRRSYFFAKAQEYSQQLRRPPGASSLWPLPFGRLQSTFAACANLMELPPVSPSGEHCVSAQLECAGEMRRQSVPAEHVHRA